MRTTPWIAVLAGCCAAFAALHTQARAQAPGGPGYPPQYAVPPSAGGPPQSGPLPPGIMPPGDMRPFPRVSPYESRFNQHFNDGGLWFNERSNAPRKYYGNASYLNGGFKNPVRTEVGSRYTLEDAVREQLIIDPTDPFGVDPGNTTLFGGIRWVKENVWGQLNDDLEIESYEFYGLSFLRDAIVIDGQGFRNPNGIVLLPFYDDEIDLADGEDPSLIDPLTGLLDLPVSGEGVDLVNVSQQGYGTLTTDALGDNVPDLHGFERALNTRSDEDDHPGLRLRFGLEEADGSGFEVTGEFLSEEQLTYRRGYPAFEDRFDDIVQDIETRQTGTFESSRDRRDFRPLPLHAILVDIDPTIPTLQPPGLVDIQPGLNAFNSPFVGGGTFVPTLAAFTYDLAYELSHTSEEASTDLAFIGSPFYRGKGLRLRPSFGVRYTTSEEQLRFRGADTGAATVFDNDLGVRDGVDIDPDINIGRIIGDGGLNVITDIDGLNVINFGDMGEFVDGDGAFRFPSNLRPYESRLESKVRNHFLGPQMGLHYDVTGEKFAVLGYVKTGLFAVNEQLQVEGFGFNIDQGITGDPMPFNDERDHTHISPFLEYNVRAEARVFEFLPLLNRSKILRAAAVQGGWTITSIWEVARPSDNIGWREANSGNPFVLDQDRSQLYWQNWDVGLSWNW